MQMENNLKKCSQDLINLFMTSWVAHWNTGGASTIQQHTTLDELYNELKDFVDEYNEINISEGNTLEDMYGKEVSSESIATANVSLVVNSLRETRKQWIAWKEDPVFSDFKGRLITRITHYIFMLSSSDKILSYFSNKKEDKLVAELKKHFTNQNEFVTTFNAYLKSKDVKDEQVKKLFKDNEGDLTELSNAILESNTQLFSLKEYYSTQSNNFKKEFNDLVNFFDLF